MVANRLFTSAIGTSLGLGEGVRFTGNRVGEPRNEGNDLSPRVGLRVLGDAADLRVVENSFLDVGDAIVFESDPDGDNDMRRLAEVDFARSPPRPGPQPEILASVKTDWPGTGLRPVVGSPFVRSGKCERRDRGQRDPGRRRRHRVVRDQGRARLPDEPQRVRWLPGRSDPDRARRPRPLPQPDRGGRHPGAPGRPQGFDILGIAVRATLGAVRAEKNDVRIRPAPPPSCRSPASSPCSPPRCSRCRRSRAPRSAQDIGNLRLGAKDAPAR